MDAPTGFEEPVLRYARERFSAAGCAVTFDVRGNCFARKDGSDPAAPVVMVIAHADEVGFMVTHVTAEGFLRFARLGGPTEMVLPGRRVRVLVPDGVLNGVIGVKPGHVLYGDEARILPPVEAMYIDIGASSRAEAESWGAGTGTAAVFDGALAAMHGGTLAFGKAVDDRAGVLAMMLAAEALRDREIAPTVAWCVSVEEETGLRGAAVAARDLLPDAVIALDTCPAGGTPDLRGDELPWRIGNGPLVKMRETRGLSTHRPLRDLFRRIADARNIPYQTVVDTAGITDATSAQQASGKIAALSLGIPRRYSHSAVELLDLRDLAALTDLLAAAIPEIRSRDMLMRV